ncbi:hypothetical protein BL250_02325 [Erwinia sp. OLTSP20]|uniref:hypothetical protein n=1 Tax=unclassified Erwinia TaxID=2622719 RepID=UPI000C187788|nr:MULTISPECIES: hypothetical protein [unclassified Erwinia]PIJ48820.1 hypothetical protein BV501_16220 [Erwinia sp. OAMSP11]PIJ69442.1 hypothetical protein BK416_15160 [Erwinia sp. OLSSP12]PIJ79276.1 hypothetical protein BLD47_15465 [Erwinia sp. OLCASP19]PIJ80802.1 hypothetical protein BLD46_14625 [Erwinia sp. OLMTSP26]PIJ82954.1 hypothetical protein BLD49_14520 [Erwinia sp. OLMDSP33]
MRTYGRDKSGKWRRVETDANGFDDSVWLTTLIQTLKLSPQESPFYATHGIPANGSVIQQILPTYYVDRIRRQFSGKFASLSIALTQSGPPVYNISAITQSGSKIVAEIVT